jgi:hypothetical protein
LHRASTVSKHFLLFHNDAHNYKITGILKQLKFRRSLRHVSVHAGTIFREPFLCLAKTTVMVLYPRRLRRGQCHGSIQNCCAGVRYTVEKGTSQPCTADNALLLFHCNRGYANAPLCYIIHILRILLIETYAFVFLIQCCLNFIYKNY